MANYPKTRGPQNSYGRTPSKMSGSVNVAGLKKKIKTVSVGKMASSNKVSLGTTHGNHNVGHATKGGQYAHKMR